MDGQNFKEEDKEKDFKLLGVWFIWFVGFNNMCKILLNYIKILLLINIVVDFVR